MKGLQHASRTGPRARQLYFIVFELLDIFARLVFKVQVTMSVGYRMAQQGLFIRISD